MLDPLTALGVVGNLLQVIEFGFKLVQEGNEAYKSAEGTLSSNQAAEELSNDLLQLTKSLTKSEKDWLGAHVDSPLDPDEVRLRNLCERCIEIAVELNVQLRKLKVQQDSKFRRFQSYKQALVSVWRKDQVEATAAQLERYQREIDTHILVGLRRSADKADLKSTKQFNALDKQTKDLTLAVLGGNERIDSRLDEHGELLIRIQEHTSRILDAMSQSPQSIAEVEMSIVASKENSNEIGTLQDRPALSTALHMASSAGDILQVRRLLRTPNVDINARDENGCTPLHLCSTSEVCQKLLADRRIDRNVEDYEGRSVLHCAVLKRRLDVVKALLEAGVNASHEDDLGKTATFYARSCPVMSWLLKNGTGTDTRVKALRNNTGLIHMAWLADVDGVRFFLDQGANVNATNENGETALLKAARNGDVAVSELLIARGADLEMVKKGHRTPLLQAVRYNRPQVVSCLLRHGAKKEARLKNGNTALIEACALAHNDIAMSLVDAGCSIDATNTRAWTPLMMAASNGCDESVRSLLRKGADPRRSDADGTSSLYVATENGHAEVTRMLLERGVSVNAKTQKGFTPLTAASRSGHIECVKQLLQHGADPDMHGAYGSGYTALAEAAHHGHLQVVETLLHNGASIETGSNSGFSALSIAAHKGKDEIISFLIGHGAKVDKPGLGEQNPDLSVTPLMRAAISGFPSTINLLVKLGADINKQDRHGRTALGLGVHKGHQESVAVLLAHDVDVNAQTHKEGHTALMSAAERGNVEVVRMLVEANANLQIRDWRGCTAWAMAIQTGHDQNLEMLLRPTLDEQRKVHRLQAERHPSEIAAYMNEVYH
jgi:ankyrin repeat protein